MSTELFLVLLVFFSLLIFFIFFIFFIFLVLFGFFVGRAVVFETGDAVAVCVDILFGKVDAVELNAYATTFGRAEECVDKLTVGNEFAVDFAGFLVKNFDSFGGYGIDALVVFGDVDRSGFSKTAILF